MEQPNWNGNILVFFKRGDQPAAFGGIRHNEPVSIIDPEAWVAKQGAVPLFADNNMDLVAYASLLLPRAQLQVIQNATAANMINRQTEIITNQTQGRVVLDDTQSVFDGIKTDWDSAGVSVPPLALTQEQCVTLLKILTADEMRSVPQVKDVNSWTSGSVTFGSGGTYSLRSSMYADIGTPSSDLFSTQISDITDYSAGMYWGSPTYNYTEDGQHFTTMIGGPGVFQTFNLLWNPTGTLVGTVTHKRLHIRALAGTSQFYGGPGSWGMVENYSNTGYQTNGKWVFANSKLSREEGSPNLLIGIYLYASGTGSNYTVANNFFNIMMDGVDIFGDYINCSFENGVIANNTSVGWPAFSVGGSPRNTVFLNNLQNLSSPGISTVNCATDKTSVGGSDSFPQVSISVKEFASVNILDPNAYRAVLVGGQIVGSGTSVNISDNTSGFYGTSRPGRAGYFSIGPDEPQLDETLLGVGLTSSGVASLGNDGTFSSNVTVGGGGFNNGHLLLGSNHMWIDSTGNLRISTHNPAFDSDGTVVGTQS